METIVIEIRAGEGGQDSKLLVEDMFNIYVRASKTHNFNLWRSLERILKFQRIIN